MASIRRRARIAALQALYELDCTQHKAEEVFAHLSAEGKLPQEGLDFSRELVRGVLQNKSELDAVIKKFASTFSTEQMPIIDRNILRLAIFEILFDERTPSDRTPLKVAINEAIELAKEFGSDSSPRLINGILGAITTERSAKP
ncbi:MAG: transcription antitermination factor NusB [Dehalococcoidia bacterium]